MAYTCRYPMTGGPDKTKIEHKIYPSVQTNVLVAFEYTQHMFWFRNKINVPARDLGSYCILASSEGTDQPGYTPSVTRAIAACIHKKI